MPPERGDDQGEVVGESGSIDLVTLNELAETGDIKLATEDYAHLRKR